RLVAVSGKQTAEKTEDVYVGMADKNAPVAELRFAYEAVRVIKKNASINVQAAFPPNHADKTYQFTTEYPVEDGFHIGGAPQFVQAPREKDIKLDVSADKAKLILSGTLVKPSGFFNKNAPPPRFAAEVKVALEKTSAPTVKNPDPVALNLQLPGTTVLP